MGIVRPLGIKIIGMNAWRERNRSFEQFHRIPIKLIAESRTSDTFKQNALLVHQINPLGDVRHHPPRRRSLELSENVVGLKSLRNVNKPVQAASRGGGPDGRGSIIDWIVTQSLITVIAATPQRRAG